MRLSMETAAEKTNLLVSAAKMVGAAVGTIASFSGTTPKMEVPDDGRLPKKHKHRLPRRQKKAMKAEMEGATRQA